MSEQTKIHAYVLLLTWLHCKASRCIVRTHICVWSASSSSSTAVEWEKRKISIFNRYLTLYTSVLCKQTVLYLESNRFCLNNKYFKRHRYVILVWLIVCYGQPERSTSFFFPFSHKFVVIDHIIVLMLSQSFVCWLAFSAQTLLLSNIWTRKHCSQDAVSII